MSTIFVLGLEDSYTRERLYQIKLDLRKSTVRFESLVNAASEIAFAKDNATESVGSSSMNQMSGGEKPKSKCCFCNTESHNSSEFLADARKNIAKHGVKSVTLLGLVESY